jgi:hypothetical protein
MPCGSMLLQDAVVLVGYSARRARKLWRGSTILSNVLLYLRLVPL